MSLDFNCPAENMRVGNGKSPRGSFLESEVTQSTANTAAKTYRSEIHITYNYIVYPFSHNHGSGKWGPGR